MGGVYRSPGSGRSVWSPRSGRSVQESREREDLNFQGVGGVYEFREWEECTEVQGEGGVKESKQWTSVEVQRVG